MVGAIRRFGAQIRRRGVAIISNLLCFENRTVDIFELHGIIARCTGILCSVGLLSGHGSNCRRPVAERIVQLVRLIISFAARRWGRVLAEFDRCAGALGALSSCVIPRDLIRPQARRVRRPIHATVILIVHNRARCNCWRPDRVDIIILCIRCLWRDVGDVDSVSIVSGNTLEESAIFIIERHRALLFHKVNCVIIRNGLLDGRGAHLGGAVHASGAVVIQVRVTQRQASHGKKSLSIGIFRIHPGLA